MLAKGNDLSEFGIRAVDDEELEVSVNPENTAVFGLYMLGGLAAAIGFFYMFIDFAPGLTAILIGVGIGGYGFLKRKSTHYVVTSKRVLRVRDFLGQKVDEIRIEDINSLRTSSEFLAGDRYGTVKISTTTSGGDLELDYVPAYQDFSNIIRDLQEQ